MGDNSMILNFLRMFVLGGMFFAGIRWFYIILYVDRSEVGDGDWKKVPTIISSAMTLISGGLMYELYQSGSLSPVLKDFFFVSGILAWIIFGVCYGLADRKERKQEEKSDV